MNFFLSISFLLWQNMNVTARMYDVIQLCQGWVACNELTDPF